MTMPQTTIDSLKALFDLGGVVVVTAMLYLVWQRLNAVTDSLIDILKELRVQGLVQKDINEKK